MKILEFIILSTYSAILQLFGLYFINIGAIFLFLTESLPFTTGVIYILKNKQYLREFEMFLLLFSLIYATIWVIANDNLGTAVRLRIFNYISILIVVSVVYIRKKNLKNIGK